MAPYVAIIIGACTIAIGINAFVVPHRLVSGGLGGLFLLSHYLFGTPVGLLTAIANLPLVYWLYRIAGWQAVPRIGVGFITFSLAVDLTAGLSRYAPTTNPLLAALFAGLLSGIGLWLTLHAGSAVGGLAVLASILRRLRGWELSRSLLLANILITSLGGVLFRQWEVVLYSWIMIFVSSVVMEQIGRELHAARLLKVYSREPDAVVAALRDHLHRGSTVYESSGGFTGERRKVVESILSPSEVALARDLVLGIDAESFMITASVYEVYGRGFTIDGTHRRIPFWRQPGAL